MPLPTVNGVSTQKFLVGESSDCVGEFTALKEVSPIGATEIDICPKYEPAADAAVVVKPTASEEAAEVLSPPNIPKSPPASGSTAKS